MPLIKTAATDLWIVDHRRDKHKMTAILIHGAGSSHLSFPKELRQLGIIDPVVVDLCGHGKSPGQGHHSIAENASDIVALLDALEIESAVIVGHSMGGAIAQTLALDHGKRVAALVLIATGARLAVNPALISGIVTDTPATIASLNRWTWSKAASESLREQSAEIMRQTDSQVIQRDFIACDRFDVRERLKKIPSKTLVMAGEHDKMTPLSLSQEMADQIPLADLEVTPQGSHMFMLELAATTAQTIEDWLGKTL